MNNARRKLELEYIRDEAEREAEEHRLQVWEGRLKAKWELERESEERDRNLEEAEKSRRQSGPLDMQLNMAEEEEGGTKIVSQLKDVENRIEREAEELRLQLREAELRRKWKSGREVDERGRELEETEKNKKREELTM